MISESARHSGMSKAAAHSARRNGSPRNSPSKDSGFLEEMTIEGVRAFKPRVAVLPLGSTEPHGPHLPYGSDTYEVTRLCRLGVEFANRGGARALLYPTLPITNNVNLKKFPFACRIGIRTLMTVIADIATQCKEDGVEKFVLVNGHGGNNAAIQAALREITDLGDRMPFVCVAARLAEDPLQIEHGGESETARMLWIRPDLVRRHKLGCFPVGRIKHAILRERSDFVRPWHLQNPLGAGGETRTATADKGKAVIEAEAKGLSELLVALSRARCRGRFPYA